MVVPVRTRVFQGLLFCLIFLFSSFSLQKLLIKVYCDSLRKVGLADLEPTLCPRSPSNAWSTACGGPSAQLPHVCPTAAVLSQLRCPSGTGMGGTADGGWAGWSCCLGLGGRVGVLLSWDGSSRRAAWLQMVVRRPVLPSGRLHYQQQRALPCTDGGSQLSLPQPPSSTDLSHQAISAGEIRPVQHVNVGCPVQKAGKSPVKGTTTPSFPSSLFSPVLRGVLVLWQISLTKTQVQRYVTDFEMTAGEHYTARGPSGCRPCRDRRGGEGPGCLNEGRW